jgi:hypothetical protein
MRWQVKCVLDRLKGMLPAQQALRDLKRKAVGFGADLDRDRGAIDEGMQMVEWVRSAANLKGARVWEIGSGWQPLIPALFSLSGAGEVIMTDVKRLCSPATLRASAGSLLAMKEAIARRLAVPEGEFERLKAWLNGDPVEKSLARMNISYLAPCDARATGLPAGSVDMMISRATLEHIPPEIIRGILAEAARILRAGGLMCHFVDCSDHWEHNDKTISRVNFLKFSDKAFGLIQWNGLNYQNRLRHPEYAAMLREAGFRITREERNVDAKSLALLETMQPAPRFRGFSREDLATVDSYFLAERAG